MMKTRELISILKIKGNIANNSERCLKKEPWSKEDPSKSKKGAKCVPSKVKKPSKDRNSHENRNYEIYFVFFIYFS